MMHRDFAGYGYAALIASQVQGVRREAKGGGELAQPRAGGGMEAAFLLGRIGATRYQFMEGSFGK